MENKELESLHNKIDKLIDTNLRTSNALIIQNQGMIKTNEILRELVNALNGIEWVDR